MYMGGGGGGGGGGGVALGSFSSFNKLGFSCIYVYKGRGMLLFGVHLMLYSG